LTAEGRVERRVVVVVVVIDDRRRRRCCCCCCGGGAIVRTDQVRRVVTGRGGEFDAVGEKYKGGVESGSAWMEVGFCRMNRRDGGRRDGVTCTASSVRN